MGPCKFDGGTFIWLSLARLWPGLAQPGQARLGQRRRVVRFGLVQRRPHKNVFFMKNIVFVHFLNFGLDIFLEWHIFALRSVIRPRSGRG